MSNRENDSRGNFHPQADMARTARMAVKDFYEFAADLTRQGTEAQLASEQRITDAVQAAVGAAGMLANSVLESRQQEREASRQFGRQLLNDVKEVLLTAHQEDRARQCENRSHQLELAKLQHKMELAKLRQEIEAATLQLERDRLELERDRILSEVTRSEKGPAPLNGSPRPCPSPSSVRD